jgi:hypothetical protein
MVGIEHQRLRAEDRTRGEQMMKRGRAAAWMRYWDVREATTSMCASYTLIQWPPLFQAMLARSLGRQRHYWCVEHRRDQSSAPSQILPRIA